MSDGNFETQTLCNWLDRMRAGDQAARNQLIKAICGRLERLTRKMLQQYSRVHRWEDTGDVLQNALVRLMRALEAVKPESTRAFFGLAAEQIRRELLDLARHYYGAYGHGAHHDTVHPSPTSEQQMFDPPENRDDPEELDRWRAFHEETEKLPADEREVVSLRFYHGWTESAIAELLQVDERTVRRRWRHACLKLAQVLGIKMPQS